MSFRPAPTGKRARPSWEREERRNLYINLGFIGAIVLALLFFAAAAVASYWDDHFVTVATVNGTTLNKDDLRARYDVERWRIQRVASNIQAALSSGRLTQDQADQQRQQLEAQAGQLPQTSLNGIVDATLQRQLADELGISVSDQEIDEALTKEATSPEVRHVWVIAVAPEASGGTVTPAATAEARTAIEGALAQVKAGTPWADVAKGVSQDPSAAQGGDLGWVSRDVGTDAFLEALFALESTGYTGVVEFPDGSLRIGQVSEIQESRVDQNYRQAITDAGVTLEAYRATLRSELLKSKLQERIVADATEKETVQRRVAEVYLQGTDESPPTAKSSHILYSVPKDKSTGQSASTGDPRWAAAEKSANTIYAQLKKDPTKFEELAKQFSEDPGSKAKGGALDWYAAAELDPAFAEAIFKDGLTEGQILGPVRSSFGWHVIRFEGRRPPPGELIGQVRQKALDGEDFGELAIEYSDASDKAAAGDMGWVARYQLSKDREDAIFAAPIGKVSEVLQTDSGWYLYLVKEEATRKPEGDQLISVKTNAFDNWYAAKKAAATITTEAAAEEPLS